MTRRDPGYQQRQRLLMKIGDRFTIDLGAKCLVAPTAEDAMKIGAAMLWPEKSDKRASALKSLRVDDFSLFDTDAKRRFERGVIAGRILTSALENYEQVNPETNRLMTLKDAKETAIAPFAKARRLGRSQSKFSLKTVDNEVWPQFEPVAHFWATFTIRLVAGNVFPCFIGDIPSFLCHAELYRGLGETIRLTRNSPGSILNASRMVSLPPDLTIAIEKANLAFSNALAEDEPSKIRE